MLSQLVWLLPVARSWQAAFMLNNDPEDLLILQQPIAGSQLQQKWCREDVRVEQHGARA
jgi:hypothetical protein